MQRPSLSSSRASPWTRRCRPQVRRCRSERARALHRCRQRVRLLAFFALQLGKGFFEFRLRATSKDLPIRLRRGSRPGASGLEDSWRCPPRSPTQTQARSRPSSSMRRCARRRGLRSGVRDVLARRGRRVRGLVRAPELSQRPGAGAVSLRVLSSFHLLERRELGFLNDHRCLRDRSLSSSRKELFSAKEAWPHPVRPHPEFCTRFVGQVSCSSAKIDEPHPGAARSARWAAAE